MRAKGNYTESTPGSKSASGSLAPIGLVLASLGLTLPNLGCCCLGGGIVQSVNKNFQSVSTSGFASGPEVSLLSSFVQKNTEKDISQKIIIRFEEQGSYRLRVIHLTADVDKHEVVVDKPDWQLPEVSIDIKDVSEIILEFSPIRDPEKAKEFKIIVDRDKQLIQLVDPTGIANSIAIPDIEQNPLGF